MDPSSIQNISDEIANHLPPYPWWAQLIAQVLLTFLAAGVGAFLSEYLKIRGHNFATKADFASLSAQLRANTELVETVKAEVNQRDWAKREWSNIRRLKLEELFEAIENLSVDLGLCLNQAHGNPLGSNVSFDIPFSSIAKGGAITSLHLPELCDDWTAFIDAWRDERTAMMILQTELLEADTDDKRTKADADFNARQSKVRAPLSKIRTNSRKLLMEIVGVTEPGPAP
jgi:hypothetical protein